MIFGAKNPSFFGGKMKEADVSFGNTRLENRF